MAKVDFQFQYDNGALHFKLKTPIHFPFEKNVKEYCIRLMKAHRLPDIISNELYSALASFIDEETTRYLDRLSEQAVLAARNINTDKRKKLWNSKFRKGLLQYDKGDDVSNMEVFSKVYHDMIHSPALETLLNLEHHYSVDVSALLEQRETDMENLKLRQEKDMKTAMSRTGADEINRLAQQQFEDVQLTESKWASELSALQESQKRDYREWLMTVHEDTQLSEGHMPAYVNTVHALSQPNFFGDSAVLQESQSVREESFTVHLGAQLKTMHNIRLIAVDVLDLCRHRVGESGSAVLSHPQRLQTAMALYSNSLCGMVLMVDHRLNSYSGIKREFAKVCEQSTDFHFTPLEHQFEKIALSVYEAAEQKRQACGDGDQASVKSSASSSSVDIDSIRMNVGDFYITCHSNLSQVHVVFHLVTDDSVHSSDLSSRHPILWGYRNIIKACYRYDIYTLTIPLFLTHEMTEEMTIQWCMKRAELVFKCVKGFIMELSTWGDQQSCNIQFLVPKNISDQAFHQITAMLPTIFRMSNPVMARS